MRTGLFKLLTDNRKISGKRFDVRAEGDTEQVYIYDQIVSSDAEAEWWGGVSAQTLAPLLRQTKAKRVELRINSVGGDVFAASAIASAIADSPAEVIAYIDGLCASAATVIACAASRVVMAETAQYMIHRAWTIGIGNASDFLDLAATLEKVDTSIAEAYATRTGKTADELLAMMDAETWFGAQAAKDAGFVDEVSAVIKSQAVAWNLSAYRNAPTKEMTQQPQGDGGQDQKAALADYQRVVRQLKLVELSRKEI